MKTTKDFQKQSPKNFLLEQTFSAKLFCMQKKLQKLNLEKKLDLYKIACHTICIYEKVLFIDFIQLSVHMEMYGKNLSIYRNDLKKFCSTLIGFF